MSSDAVELDPDAIGATLRERRERLGIGLDDIERATHIRRRQLLLLEEGRFDQLPGDAYARGFLRSYAEYVGLDPQRVVDAFNARRRDDEPDIVRAVRTAPDHVGRPMFSHRSNRRPLALYVAVTLLAVSVLVWMASTQLGDDAGSTVQPPAPTTPSTTPPASNDGGAGTGSGGTSPQPAAVNVAATAIGDCWLEVRRKSPTGPVVYQGTLAAGRVVHVSGKRIWMRVGAPPALDLRVNGRKVPGLDEYVPVNLTITPNGVKRA
jgi:cytoskeletal protein RodZ